MSYFPLQSNCICLIKKIFFSIGFNFFQSDTSFLVSHEDQITNYLVFSHIATLIKNQWLLTSD